MMDSMLSLNESKSLFWWWSNRPQQYWTALLDIIGDDDLKMWVWMPTALLIISHWLYCSIFILIDMIPYKPGFLLKFKIQPDKNNPINKKQLFKAIKLVLINQFFVTPIFLYLVYTQIIKYMTFPEIRLLPQLNKIMFDLLVIIVIEEIFFYYTHRLLHHRLFYKYLHKKHHEWSAPMVVTTLYCHPIEHISSNMGPIIIGTLLTKTHVCNVWLFTVIAIINSISDHSGYSFPFSSKSVRFHDYHHSKFNYNFGILGWLDKVHGTYIDTSSANG